MVLGMVSVSEVGSEGKRCAKGQQSRNVVKPTKEGLLVCVYGLESILVTRVELRRVWRTVAQTAETAAEIRPRLGGGERSEIENLSSVIDCGQLSSESNGEYLRES
jgi:hypothetical protein